MEGLSCQNIFKLKCAMSLLSVFFLNFSKAAETGFPNRSSSFWFLSACMLLHSQWQTRFKFLTGKKPLPLSPFSKTTQIMSVLSLSVQWWIGCGRRDTWRMSVLLPVQNTLPLEMLDLFEAPFSLPLGSLIHHHISVDGVAGFATTWVKFLSSLVFLLKSGCLHSFK